MRQDHMYKRDWKDKGWSNFGGKFTCVGMANELVCDDMK